MSTLEYSVEIYNLFIERTVRNRQEKCMRKERLALKMLLRVMKSKEQWLRNSKTVPTSISNFFLIRHDFLRK